MTTKDYIKFAKMLAEHRPDAKDWPHIFITWQGIRDKTADIFEADNPNFSRYKFIEACHKSE